MVFQHFLEQDQLLVSELDHLLVHNSLEGRSLLFILLFRLFQFFNFYRWLYYDHLLGNVYS